MNKHKLQLHRNPQSSQQWWVKDWSLDSEVWKPSPGARTWLDWYVPVNTV